MNFAMTLNADAKKLRMKVNQFAITTNSGLRCMTLLFVFAVMMFANSIASAQVLTYAETGTPPESGLELLQEEPHDILFLTDKSGSGWAKVHLLPFRKMPSQRTGGLKFRVVGIEAIDLAVKWSEVDKIDFWEERLERETKSRIAKGDFSGAYPFLSVLIRDYPNRPGLREIRSEFLWNDARARMAEAQKGGQQGDVGPTLAMLEELRRFAPEFQRSTVLNAIGVTTDLLMNDLREKNELRLAQQLLARLEKDYGSKLSSITKWNKIFLDLATAKRKEAIAAAQRKDYIAARGLARDSINLKPDIPGGAELVKKIDTIYPLVNVGVLQTATNFDPNLIHNWAARRSGRLLYRSLFEIKGAGASGGDYEFIFGEAEVSSDRQNLDLFLNPSKLPAPLNKVNGFHVADVLTSRVQEDNPLYFSPWAASVVGIGLIGPQQIHCDLRRPHVLPTSLLQITVDGSWFGGKPGSPTGDYRRGSVKGDITRYLLVNKDDNPTKPREIVETRMTSASDAISKLLNGEVDVLDQLFPADAIRLSRNKTVKVKNYPLPMVHMLVPCSDHIYVSNKTFRRGMLYGTNRDDILKGELLEQQELEGCRVVSGPFPAGLDSKDPLGYAYDQKIKSRQYEPSLAQLLLAVAENQMKVSALRKGDDEPPSYKKVPIRLAFPADNLSRVACEAIRTQWTLIGLDVKLVELPVGTTFPEKDVADITYVAAAVWEPIIDARRLLGPGGLAGSESQMVGLGLRRLEEARNWKEVRDRLLDLHAITHHELPIIPLWQMVDSYAYRRELFGMGNDIVSLYQNAGNWRLE